MYLLPAAPAPVYPRRWQGATTYKGSMSFRVEGNTLLTARPAEAGFVADA